MVLDAIGLLFVVAPRDIGREVGFLCGLALLQNYEVVDLLCPVPKLHKDFALFGHCLMGNWTKFESPAVRLPRQTGKACS